MLKHDEDRNNLHCQLHATKLHLRDKQLNRVFPSAISNLKQKKYKPWKNVGSLSFPQRFVSFNQGAEAAHARWIYKLSHVLILFCILRDYESLFTGFCITNSIKLSKRRNIDINHSWPEIGFVVSFFCVTWAQYLAMALRFVVCSV